MSALPVRSDPTLAAADVALEMRDAGGGADWRPYLGASQLGKACDRSLWLSFRWARERRLSAKSLKAIADGHHGETVMAERLAAVPGVQLWTVDEKGQQFGFSDLNGHLRGHVDGLILGLLQAPKTPHIWEHKQVNEKKFAKLAALAAGDEKAALEAWDTVYFVQAQLYMHYTEFKRHYLTCSTPGGRAQTSCRTAYQPDVAEWAIARAKRIIDAARPPLKISEDPAYWECKFCDYHPLCHGREIAAVHCRTCAHSTAISTASEELDHPEWVCERHQRTLTPAEQPAGCSAHLLHPDLMEYAAEMMDGDPEAGTITYRMRDTGVEFKNGLRPSPDSKVFTSHEIRCAAAGCKDPLANVAWMDAVNEANVVTIRQTFDAEIVGVQLLENPA